MTKAPAAGYHGDNFHAWGTLLVAEHLSDQDRQGSPNQKQDSVICIHWRGLESNSCLELQGLTIDQDSSSPVRGSYYEETNFSTQVLTQN